MNGMLRQLRLYIVIDPAFCLLDPLEVAAQVVTGGATSIQLRTKQMSDRETLSLAQALRAVVPESVLFFVNDRIDIGLAADANGVHLGVSDLPLEAARSLSPQGFVIGYSPETDDEARDAGRRGADYLGVGPIYGTNSKSDAGPAVGIEMVTRRQELSQLPVVGIGGITADNARSVVEAGACGVAVMSAVTRSPNPEQSVRELLALLPEPK